ncbi:MAG: hypothetical protein AB8G77_13015, partial [Rhodothermales bacterium]
MKTQILSMLSALALFSTTANAQETEMNNYTPSLIDTPAATGNTQPLAELLTRAAPLVKEPEPGTELWFALHAAATLAIFDIFVSEEARNAHFSGAVAGALNQNADTL